MAQENLKDKTAKGIAWGMVNNGAIQVVNIIVGLFLARLLSPGDYGMVGVLAIFIAIAGTLQTCGFSQALTNLKEITNADYNAVFWFNVLVGIVCYIILFFSAPIIAEFFHQDALVELSRVLFISFVISALGYAHNAYMFRNMMVQQTAIVNFVSLLIAGLVGVIMAYYGFKHWSLVVQQLVLVSVSNLVRLYYVPWHPSIKIDLRPLRPMLKFSLNMLLTRLVNIFSGNLLTVYFGRNFPISVVGNFTQANKWETMGHSFLTGIVDQIAQPVLARISEDQEREKKVFRKMMRFMAFLSFPFMFGLSLVSREFIIFTIGERWIDSIPLLRALCIGGAFIPFYNLYQNLIISKGKANIYLFCNVLQVLMLVLLIVLFSPYGMMDLVYAYASYMILFLCVWQYYAHKLIGVKLMEIVYDIMPFMLSSIFVMMITYIITMQIDNLFLLLFIRIFIAGLLYFVVMKFTGAKILQECINYVKQKTCKR